MARGAHCSVRTDSVQRPRSNTDRSAAQPGLDRAIELRLTYRRCPAGRPPELSSSTTSDSTLQDAYRGVANISATLSRLSYTVTSASAPTPGVPCCPVPAAAPAPRVSRWRFPRGCIRARCRRQPLPASSVGFTRASCHPDTPDHPAAEYSSVRQKRSALG